jgi:hypothetical protein
MKRLDDGKVSLVDFMRSIRSLHRKTASQPTECTTHFAGFNPRARDKQSATAEDQQLVRSAN